MNLSAEAPAAPQAAVVEPTADAVARLRSLDPMSAGYATDVVDAVLDFAETMGTSDVHVQPARDGLEIRYRRHGVLQLLDTVPMGVNASVIARLKVLSGLLTYQSDVPQEGRVESPPHGREIRVSTFPTLRGERGVLRFFGHAREFTTLDELGNAADLTTRIRDALDETSGAVLITGPAGSGKSTTLYACLRHLVAANGGGRSIVSIEDPIEVPIDGVAQSQVDLASGFDLKTGLRSLMRQDPEVIMVGEIRDRDTAEFAIQASLTGQLLLATFHADSAASAVTRLIEMGIEPFLVRSGLIVVICQRLLRLLCLCGRDSGDPADLRGLPLERARVPVGCPACQQTGYVGRMIVSEFLDLRNPEIGGPVLRKADSRELHRLATSLGMEGLRERALRIVQQGRTSPAELVRVLGSTARS
jgi:type II secretory ATPase GspE/PulE/Tfp pilus assembly ATPase PilB-like protein